MVLAILLVALLSVSFADAANDFMLRLRPSVPRIPVPERAVMRSDGTALPPLKTVYYFDQLIDHDKPSLGTFQQRYWMNWEFYEAGGPIILMAPIERNADGYQGFLTNLTMNGMIAQQQQGATVIIEHRFFGYSNPRDNLTSQSLELLKIQQVIDDIVYFAQNVDLPMPGGDNVKPDTTSWVLVGGSYSGALTSWTMVNKPGVFRAGYASSATVEAIVDFYGYFTPILEYMPRNCSLDVQAVIAYLDHIYAENNTAAIQDLKDAFGLGNLSRVDDFASALKYNLVDWQPMQPDSPGTLFYKFCDALEVKDGVSASADGWGLKNAIEAWGSYWNNTYYKHGKLNLSRKKGTMCGTVDAESCLGMYDAKPSLTDVTVDNSGRSWAWIVCNQLGYNLVGPPPEKPALVSRIVKSAYYERQCLKEFPQAFADLPSPSVDQVNMMYAGWNVNVDRLFLATGRRDPWREATVSAESMYTSKANTTTQPIYKSDGFHCSDMYADIGSVDETVGAVQRAALKFMKIWLA